MKKLLAALVMLLCAGAVAADPDGSVLFADWALFRGVRQGVDQVVVPPLPDADCVVADVRAEIVREISFLAGGFFAPEVHLSDFAFGVFLDEHELLVEQDGALDLSLPHFPPGSEIHLVFVYDVSADAVSVDPLVLDSVSEGPLVQYVFGGGGGTAGGSGSFSMRIGASVAARFEFQALASP